MNIALVGVPGSGKSKLAEQLAEAFFAEEKTVVIVDHYIPMIEERTGWALGPFGDYVANLYVALDRYVREGQARRPEVDIVITCGTLLETAVHLATYLVGWMEIMDDQEKEDMAPQIEAVLRMFAVLYNDIIDYDHAFYLPPVEPTQEAEFMDKQLQSGVGGFKLMQIVPLENLETRLEDALKVVTSEVQAS